MKCPEPECGAEEVEQHQSLPRNQWSEQGKPITHHRCSNGHSWHHVWHGRDGRDENCQPPCPFFSG